MNYDALMAFAVFAEHRNFTHAAEELHISQPALHTKVNKLADQVGARLYTKLGRDLVITEAGRLLAKHAREVSSLNEDVLARLEDQQQRGPVSLVTGRGAYLHLLGPAILEAREGPYPLRLLTKKSPSAARAVLEARAHVAMGVFSGAPDELDVTPWHKYGQMVVVPESHHLATREKLHPTDLDGESLIIAPAGQPHRLSTAQVLDEHDVSWNVAVEATGWNLMVQFVSYGVGITIINDFVPLPDDLVGIPVSDFPTVEYDVAIHRDTSHDGARWLRDLLCEF